ncbi:MAG: glycosyltransferase [Granulosicoccus sp.]
MNPFSGGCHFVEGFPLQAYSKFDRDNTRIKQKVLQGKDLTIVSPSRWLSGVSLKSEAFGQFPHHVIPYGIDVNTFRLRDRNALRERLGIKPDARVLLFVADGIKNKRKGFQHLLTALGEAVLQNQFTLVVAGKQTDDFTLPESSIELGHVKDREEMACVYSAADFFVTPAIEDNLPNTVLESLCCGTPVIAFNIGGMPDMIEHGKNGILCDAVDGLKLAESIQMALNIDFNKEGISREARSRYSPENQAQAYLDIYQRTVQNN